jgi:hypothetical protein
MPYYSAYLFELLEGNLEKLQTCDLENFDIEKLITHCLSLVNYLHKCLNASRHVYLYLHTGIHGTHWVIFITHTFLIHVLGLEAVVSVRAQLTTKTSWVVL